jgi:hypothetical protein
MYLNMATDLYTQMRLALIKSMWVPRDYKLTVTTDEIQLQVALVNPLKKSLVPLALSLPLAQFSEETLTSEACAAFCSTLTELATNPTSSINKPSEPIKNS